MEDQQGSGDLTPGHVGGTSDWRGGSRKTLGGRRKGLQVQWLGQPKHDRFFCELNEGRREVLRPLPCLFHVECGIMVP